MGKVSALAVVILAVSSGACSSVGSGRTGIRDDVSLDQQLFSAAELGNAKLVKALLARGANPNTVVKTTPLPNGRVWSDTSYIASACASGFSPEVFDLVVAAGGDMNTRRSQQDELPPPFQGCNASGSFDGRRATPGTLLRQMIKNGYVLPSPQKISEYLVRYPSFLDDYVMKDVIAVLPPSIAAAVVEDARAKMAADKRSNDEAKALRLAEQKRRSDEEYAKASPEWRRVLDEQKRIVRAHDQGLTGTTSKALAPPRIVGDMVCRKGRLQYQTCTNPSFPQSCVSTSVPGVMYGWAEAFSADQSRAQIRSGGVEVSGTVRYPIHSQVTLEGLGAGKGDVFWDTTTSWYICHWVDVR